MPEKYLIYEVKFSMCYAIYIVNTQQTLKKIMDGHLFNILRLLKNGQIPDSFAAHLKYNFKSTTSCTDLRKCMTSKVVNQTDLICAMKTFTKHNCNLCLEKRLTILKELFEKNGTLMHKNLEIYRAWRHKNLSVSFS